MEKYCSMLNSLGDGISGSMMEHIVQYNTLYTDQLHVCDSFISSLPTLISCIYILFNMLHSLQVNFNASPNRMGKGENYTLLNFQEKS